ncbi:Mov34/MPN/PAD-1 family protein [Heliorestis convoluta]|uniref:Mov34/MPN/PAD-1 family protein n=1 Tax=Heliorestis convoluta TaxID=356322 RepID=UPI00138A2C0C|nr:Mov34/MPN/PAD-1 family protein [Heliorestis convoluta]
MTDKIHIDAMTIEITEKVALEVATVLEKAELEYGGLLLGNVFFQEKKGNLGAMVKVEAFLPAKDIIEEQTSIRFTDKTWDDWVIQRRNYPSMQVVGWVHSHPGYGIFFSGQDVINQQLYFSRPWNIAWVVDPKQGLQGFFHWRYDTMVETENWHVMRYVAPPSCKNSPKSDPISRSARKRENPATTTKENEIATTVDAVEKLEKNHFDNAIEYTEVLSSTVQKNEEKEWTLQQEEQPQQEQLLQGQLQQEQEASDLLYEDKAESSKVDESTKSYNTLESCAINEKDQEAVVHKIDDLAQDPLKEIPPEARTFKNNGWNPSYDNYDNKAKKGWKQAVRFIFLALLVFSGGAVTALGIYVLLN